MAKLNFWLLDINYETYKDERRAEIWMWGICEDGSRVLVIDRNFLAYFYLLISREEEPKTVFERIQQQKAELPLIVNIELTTRRLFGEPASTVKVYCQDPDLIPKYATALSKVKGVEKCLEGDFRYSMRYLVDNDVMPCSWHEIEVEEERNSKVQVDKVYTAKSAPKRIEKEELPSLKVLSFFPVYYGSKGAPKPDKDPLLVISTATNTGEKRQFIASNHNDRDLMKTFIEYFKVFDPDIIVGYETNRRHWQYLADRAKNLGLELLIDRAETWPHLSMYGHISITGRASMDMLDFADEFPELKVKTLENMTDFLGVKRLNEQKIIDETEFASYWDDISKRSELLAFSSEKAECLLGIFEKIFEYSVELSKLVGLPLDLIGKAAVGFRIEWYLIREAFKIGELTPERVERPYVSYAGGMVLSPLPGIHENIAVLDFKSMYPNIMIEKNISPDTYIPPEKPLSPSDVHIAPEVGHRFRKNPPGFYKKVLTNLLTARESIKRKLKELPPESFEHRVLSAREKAVKVITNAAYGYAGWVGARWFIKPVAEATTAWGRETIMSTIEMAKSLGLEVIYGDTDSIFVKYDQQKIEALSKMIEDRLGLEIKPDKLYTRIFFTEAKKRYCGLLPNGSLDIVGLEVVRGDWANVAKNTQEHVLELILKERSAEKAVEFVHRFIESLRERKTPFRDLIIWKTLTKPLDQYEVNAPHVEAARILEKSGWALSIGDKVGYVITQGQGRLYERAKPHVMASYEEVDVEYYVRNQIVPAALRVLSMFGVKEDDLLTPSLAKKPKSLADFFQ